MKLYKKLTTLFLTASIAVLTSVNAFATPNDDIITALKDAKVPATYLIQAENYLKTTNLTAAQSTSVIAQIKSADDILKASGVTDPTKLSADDKKEILAYVTSAGKILDLTVNATKASNGKYAVVVKDNSGKAIANLTSSDVKQTGIDNSIIYVGTLLIILAGGSVFILRKNSLKSNA